MAWRARADLPLVVAANRDEFFARPSAPAEFWTDHPQVLAGRDLKAGGTWMGVTRGGRFAAVTNFRDARAGRAGKRSRGLLVSDFLLSGAPPRAFLSELEAVRSQYDGFNLLAGNADGLYHYSNRGGAPVAVQPGVHGLSNHFLDTPWSKVQRGKAALVGLLAASRETLMAGLFAALEDPIAAADEQLPDTGVALEWERALSSPFIRATGYGTRASTVLLVGRDGDMTLLERGYSGPQAAPQERRFSLRPIASPGLPG